MSSDEKALIDELWSFLLNSTDPRLRAIVSEAARHPNLRRLFPFASLSNLHFSRKIAYPYDYLP